MNINEYVNLNWSDFILSLSMELAWGTDPIRLQIVADRMGLGINEKEVIA